VENTDPPAALYEDTIDVPFTKLVTSGRYGFFPVSETVEPMFPDGEAISKNRLLSTGSRMALSRASPNAKDISGPPELQAFVVSSQVQGASRARASFVACFASYRISTTS
jgi:hypothetical protein